MTWQNPLTIVNNRINYVGHLYLRRIKTLSKDFLQWRNYIFILIGYAYIIKRIKIIS